MVDQDLNMTSLAEILEPMPGKIAVQVAVKDEIFGGGLYIPVDVARSVHEVKPTQGVIISMGDESLEEADHNLEVGDHVVFGKYSGTQITWQPDRSKPAEKIIMLQFKDILCKLNVPEESGNLTVKG
jgi:co-chaperonin GroES (HSP10)